jgi:TRAP-type transport system periplasmic protein
MDGFCLGGTMFVMLGLKESRKGEAMMIGTTGIGALRLWVGLVILILCIGFMAVPASAKYSFKLGHTDQDDPFSSPDQAAAEVFKNAVEVGTNGEITVEIFPANALGKERESLGMLRSGEIQGYLATAVGARSLWALVGVLDFPFAIPSYSVAYDVLDGWFGDQLKRSILAKTGLRCIEITDAGGFHHLTNNKRLIRTPQDMKGIKFRTGAMPSRTGFFESLGASSVSLSRGDIRAALQTEVVDGQQSPLGFITSSKLYEVQKYLTLTRHLYGGHFFLVNEKWFQSIPDRYKGIVTEAARLAKTASRGITLISSSTERGITLLSRYMQVYLLTDRDRENFVNLTGPAMRKWVRENLGEEGVALEDDFFKAIEESKKKGL